MAKHLLVTPEIAHQLGVSERTVRRLYSRGRLKGAYKVGGRTSPIRISVDDLERFKREGGKS